ncbi:ABC transporter ATP-binding protein [Gramella sp. AN32]|uniref:ABC transporter ATP-binding protein n=1 Tax=Christiangramia antarctica TaxID=2058158 RepID=A0ABW5X554_9FLAO|nr:ABC transporter ATP-binding protein [Gramella sp. AN32]MCM4157119.1 ABC transporter ATP-binding protein [Gramella sp. AN32]
MKLKEILKNNFHSFFYFFRYLRYRMLVMFFLSLTVGVLDGLGLAMFIPLLQMFDTEGEAATTDLGKLQFLPDLLLQWGISFDIFTVLILILLFFALKGIAKFIQTYADVIFMQFFMRTVRITNIHLMNTFSYSHFVTADSGRIQNTFSGEVEKLNRAFSSYMTSIQHATLIFVYLVMALGSNFSFAIMAGIGGGATNMFFKFLYKKSKALSREITSENHIFHGLLIQHVAFFKYLKATGLNLKYSKKLIKSITKIENIQRRIGFISSILLGAREPLTILVVVGTIILQIKYFGANIGSIILSLLLLYRALTYLMAMQAEWNRFLAVSGSLENMDLFVRELKSGKEVNGEQKLNDFNSKISIKDVSFSYGDTRILDSINLNIQKNETVALIGSSGSGKTTLMNILAGLLVPEKGNLMIDNYNYKDLDKYTLKHKIGYISQESPIFNDSIFNNVTFWEEKTEENKSRFIDAIKKASLYEYIMKLPFKEDENLGNNGINISGGQKQRLAIARELYKNVDILFMDEATSSLDGETEANIQNNIEALKGEYTIVMIAHRLSTIKNADRIILLSEGVIKAIGTYKSLLETSVEFREMIQFQDLN